MALDEHKRPIICKHPNVEKDVTEHWTYACPDCGLKFKNKPIVRPTKRRR